ncbi:hypothetical protein [Rhizobium leguminosarum]|uniref:Uncharacterized protein n=1 Tax=Rhizobium leguminosarum TaxID=384 RepID=A0A1B1CCT7_RHILE|nr:hypothetical protein [Rhizobium leguminosarum]ANP87570.1 hypothetical protein BA011_18785 [Rhizobium leguminosarum]
MTAPISLFLAAFVLISTISFSTKAAELPVFQGYCEEVSQHPIKPAQRFLAYMQCNNFENRFKEQLQKHWFLVTDDDMKICMKYKGTKNETKSYQQLMGCLSQAVGEKCYSGKLTCRGKTL